MDRLACVDLSAFPLQLLCLAHPEWDGLPVAVVAEDKPQGRILWVNAQARRLGVRAGLRYAAGLSLVHSLRAATVDEAAVAAGLSEVLACLQSYSPEVARAEDEPGVFWLNAAGLAGLFGSLETWAQALYEALQDRWLSVAVLVGYSRFGSFALARKQGRGVRVLTDLATETRELAAVPLCALSLAPRLEERLRRLGVLTVGALCALPQGGVLERFGQEAHVLWQRAAGTHWDPLQPEPPRVPISEPVELDDAEHDSQRLVFAIKRALHVVLERLARSYQVLETLILTFELVRTGRAERAGQPACADQAAHTTQAATANHATRVDVLQPSEPTLDVRVLVRLLQLRLEAQPLQEPVTRVLVDAHGVRVTREQLALFVEQPKRDLAAAAAALAHLRAVLGDAAVVVTELREAHLPEARWVYRPVKALVAPRPPASSAPPLAHKPRTLIRRIFPRAELLPPQETGVRDDGWLLAGLRQGPICQLHGPYIISGGWWQVEVHREYYFAETRRGELLWIYYDRRRRRWFQQGRVQ